MNVKPTQKTTKLGTTLTFEVLDLRGKRDFPQGQDGLVFVHHEKRTIRCKYTGCEIKRKARYAIRTAAGEQGWRIDLLPDYFLPPETVYGLAEGRPTHWASKEEAAQALVAVLDEIEHNSSLFR